MQDEQPPTENIPLEAYEGSQMTLPAAARPSALMVETKGGIITARKVELPRDLRIVKQQLKILAEMAGEDWYYRWPVKNSKGNTDWVEGPSVKCAQAVARVYGNCQVDCTVQDRGSHLLFEARFVDLETGYSLTRPFQQRLTQNLGKKMDAARQADIVFQIGVSKATRNVICNALETFSDFAMEEAKNSLVDKIGKNIERSRARMLQILGDHKISIARVEFAYQRKSAEWLAPDMARMHAEIKAIDDGMANVDETYPPTPDEMAKEEKQIQTDKKSEEAATKSDLDGQIDGLITGVEACKDADAVEKIIEENKELLAMLDKTGSNDTKKKWLKAVQKAEFKPKKGK